MEKADTVQNSAFAHAPIMITLLRSNPKRTNKFTNVGRKPSRGITKESFLVRTHPTGFRHTTRSFSTSSHWPTLKSSNISTPSRFWATERTRTFLSKPILWRRPYHLPFFSFFLISPQYLYP